MNWTFCWLPLDSCSARRSARSSARNRRSQAIASRFARSAGTPWSPAKNTSWSRTASAGTGRAPRAGSPTCDRGRRWLSVPRQRDLAGVRLQHAERDPHRRGLARAVRARGSRRPARRDLEREVVEGDDGPEALDEVVDDEAHPRPSIAGRDRHRPLRDGPEPASMMVRVDGCARVRAGAAVRSDVQDPRIAPSGSMPTAPPARSPSAGPTATRPTYDTVTLRWLCPCAYCRGEAGHARLARQQPHPDAGADAPRRRRARRHLRDPGRPGATATHTGYHTFTLLRDDVPVRRVRRGAPRRSTRRPTWRGSDDHRDRTVRRRAPRHGDAGPGVRARRPEPRPRRQPHRRPALHRGRRDPRVHEPARGHPPPGHRPDGPERDARRRQRGHLDALRLVRAGRDDVRDRGLRHGRRRRCPTPARRQPAVE